MRVDMDARRLKRLIKVLKEEGVARYAFEDSKERVSLDLVGGPAPRAEAAPRRKPAASAADASADTVESYLRNRFAPVPGARRAS